MFVPPVAIQNLLGKIQFRMKPNHFRTLEACRHLKTQIELKEEYAYLLQAA